MEQNWYIRDGQRTVGPHSLTEIHELISVGQVSKEASFGVDDLWVDLDTFKKEWPVSQDHSNGGQSGQLAAAANSLGSQKELDSKSSQLLTETLSRTESALPIERDAILILGRRRAGKTVYLATLYSDLWKAVGGVTMKALSGPVHLLLLSVADQLKKGQWPDATLGTRQLEFELNYQGAKHLLVAFDYSGEDFRRAFIEDDTSSPEVKRLLDYVDRASAVILLMDPSVMVSGKHDEVVDDDFGMVQAVERVRNWPGGDQVPVVVALTKADRNNALIKEHRSAPEFVLRHYPALARTLGRVQVFNICAVQETEDGEGKRIPKPDSVPINIQKPLLYCFEEFRKRDERRRQDESQQAAVAAHKSQVKREYAALALANRRLWIYVGGFIVLIICGLASLYFILTR